MRRHIAAAAIGLGIFALHVEVHAQSCTTRTFIIEGKVTTCVVCCIPGGHCTTTCN